MKRIKAFFYILKQTFTSPAYYADILKAPFSLSLKFFYTFFLVYSLIFTIYTTFKVILPLNDLLNFLPERLISVYPSELEITIKDGQASTNVPEPYKIPLKDIKNVFNEAQKRVLGESADELKYLFVVDTKGRIENFSRYQTYILLTKNHLSYVNDDGNIETVSLAEVDDLTVNRGAVERVVNLVTPFLKWVTPTLIVLVFLFFLISYPTSKLFYLLFFTLILLIIGKLIKFPLSYRKGFQLGVHLIIIPTTILSIFNLVGFSLSFPFLQTIFLTILGAVVLRKIKALQALPAVSPSPPPAEKAV